MKTYRGFFIFTHAFDTKKRFKFVAEIFLCQNIHHTKKRNLEAIQPLRLCSALPSLCL